MSRAPDPAIAAFVAMARDILRSAIDVDTAPGVVLPRRSQTDDRVAVIIHARGDISGVTWLFPIDVARRAARAMAPSLTLDAQLCVLAITELANVVTARCLEALAVHGVDAEIEPPQIAVASAQGIAATLHCELGPIDVVFHGLGSPE